MTKLSFYAGRLNSEFGLQVSINILSAKSGLILLQILAATVLILAIPSLSAYRRATHQSL